MNLWKNKWKAELDDAKPKLRADVLNCPINAAPSQSGENVKQTSAPVYKRKPFWFVSSSAVAVLLVVVLCATLIPSAGTDVYAFVVEINPAITLSADASGNVTGIVASNADADVILSDTNFVNGLKGKPVGEAVKLYVDRAAMLGYVDVNDVSAVRISSLKEGNKLLDGVRSAVEGYFMEQGITAFVICDAVDVKILVERGGLDVKKDVNAIVKSVQTAETLFRNRGAKELSKDELKKAYSDYVVSYSFAQSVREYLNGLLGLIEQNEQDVNALVKLNDDIVKHSGNPALLLKDYWSVKAIYDTYDDAEFALLMTQMDEALKNYKTKYGQSIDSSNELDSLRMLYKFVSADDLREFLSSLDLSFLQSNLDWLSQVLDVVAADSPLVGLTTLPETATEFVGKMRDALTVERAAREKRFDQAYNSVRDAISSSDYAAFKQSLLDKYGSANEVWNNLK